MIDDSDGGSLSEVELTPETTIKNLDKCISLNNNGNYSVESKVDVAKWSQRKETNVTTTMATETPMLKVDNDSGKMMGSSPSSSSLSSLMDKSNDTSSTLNVDPSSSSSFVYRNCPCSDKSLLRHIGSEFEDTETREKFKIVGVVKARDNRCDEETFYFKYYDLEMFKECPKKEHSFEYTPCYELLYELTWVKWISSNDSRNDRGDRKGDRSAVAVNLNEKKKVYKKNNCDNTSKGSRSVNKKKDENKKKKDENKKKKDEKEFLVEMPPTELEEIQMVHPENESSYPFDYKLRRVNYASDVCSCISGPSGAEILAQSLLLSTTNTNDVLDDIFDDPYVSHIDTQVRQIDAQSEIQRRGRLDRFNQRALLFHLHAWMNPTGKCNNVDLTKLTVPLIQDIIMKVPRDIDELAAHCGSEYGLDLIVENSAMLKDLCDVVENFCQSRVIPFNDTNKTLRESYTRLHENTDGRGDANSVYSKTIDENCIIDDLIALKARIPMSNYAFRMAISLTYKRLGGDREAFEGKGGGTKGATVFDEKDTSIRFQYGGMSESFIQEMCERCCVGKDDTFVDIGSGIGQIVIQVAATMGCKSWGYEVVEQRHNHAILLKRTFIDVLRDGKVLGVDYVDSLIELHCAKFQDRSKEISAASVIFFNNFAHYFTQLMDAFVENVGSMKVGTRIVTLSSVHELAKRCSHYNAPSMIEACNWKQNKLDVNYYTKVSNGWTCDGPSGCGYDRNDWDAEECERCAKRKFAKRNKRDRDVVDR